MRPPPEGGTTARTVPPAASTSCRTMLSPSHDVATPATTALPGGSKPGFEDALQEFRRNAGPIVLDREQHRARQSGGRVRRIVPQILCRFLPGSLALDGPQETFPASALRRDADCARPWAGRRPRCAPGSPESSISSLRRAGSSPRQGRHAICSSVTGPAMAERRLPIWRTASERSATGVSGTGVSFARTAVAGAGLACAAVRASPPMRSTRLAEADVIDRISRRSGRAAGPELPARRSSPRTVQRRHQVARIMGNPCQSQSIAALFAQRWRIPDARKRKRRKRCGRTGVAAGDGWVCGSMEGLLL